MLEYMLEREIPFIIVLTKSDKLNKSERAKRLAAFDSILADLEGVTVIPFSAVNGEGADEIRSILDQVIADDE
jgi:GTP-binding protein